MEILSGDEFRLTYALLLAGAALLGAWRFVARRVATDWADRAADVLLLFLLVQYLSVGVPGLLGVLNPFTIALCTLGLAAGLYFLPARAAEVRVTDVPGENAVDRWALVACAAFAVGYVLSIVVYYSLPPITANDPLTYHAPAAVRWLQTGRLGLFETWFFNPANTYSPLAGSTFIAWWIAPLGNDVLARTVQDPPLILVFFAAVRLMRGMGVRSAVAAIVALALVQCQPLIRQSIFEKDDVALAAFFTCLVAGLGRDRLRDPMGPWRVGVALGLLLATKYTAMLALPVVLLAVDAPFRARWRLKDWGIAVVTPLLLAGPWYLRNVWLTGNPLFPLDVKVAGVTLFEGLFATARSEQLRSFGSVWRVLTHKDQSLPVWPFLCVAAGLVAAGVAAVRARRLSDPLVRACVIGPVVGLFFFVAASPYAEVRFLYPALVLAYAAVGLAIVAWVPGGAAAQVAAAVLFYLPSALTGFEKQHLDDLNGGAVLFTILVLPAAWAWGRWPARRKGMLTFAGAAVALVYAGYVYVQWSAHVSSVREIAQVFYKQQYGPVADVWDFVRKELPPDEPIAYANTYLVHPLSGFDHRRRAFYVPTRRGVTHLRDLPHLEGPQTGETLVKNVAAVTVADPDARPWLERLFASGATHLVVFNKGVVTNPPELEIVGANADRFERVFANEAGVVFRLRR